VHLNKDDPKTANQLNEDNLIKKADTIIEEQEDETSSEEIHQFKDNFIESKEIIRTN